MAVRIRLRRMGRKKQPHYRIVVADSAAPRDGRFVETLGYYKPLSEPARVVVDLERVDHWVGQGAIQSGTVKSLLKRVREGGDDTVAVGEPDVDAQREAKAEALAAKRQAEADAAAKAEEEAKLAAEAAAKAEAEAAAAAEAEAAAGEAEAESADEDAAAESDEGDAAEEDSESE